MSQEAAGAEAFPTSNYLVEIKDLRDIADVLKITMRLKEPLARIAVTETVREELEDLREWVKQRARV